MPATPALKLTYFDVEGRAGVIRKTLAVAGVPFEDERLSQDQFKQLKSNLPYGKVPVLEVDGVVMAETQAILRYVGRVAGMYPSPSVDPLAAAMVDEMLDSFDDFFERLMMPSFVETDAEKKKHMRAELLNGPLPNALELLDKRLAQTHEYKFFQDQAKQLSVLDVLAWNYVAFMRSGMVDHIPTTFIDQYKTMVAMYNKVEATPRINPRDTPAAATVASPPPIPKSLKLTYFDMPGRAEQIRLALHIGGISFLDERLSFQDISQRKSSFPNGQVPVLEINGEVPLAQSLAILRYVGSLTGLYPTQDHDLFRASRIDEVLSHIGELYFALDPSFAERDADKKKQMRDQLTATTIPMSLSGLDKRLAHWKNQCTKQDQSAYVMGGHAPTIADLGIYSLVQFLQSGVLDHVPTTIVDQYGEIVKASEAVKQHPRVVAWYAKTSQSAV